jgi:hypothetical protein
MGFYYGARLKWKLIEWRERNDKKKYKETHNVISRCKCGEETENARTHVMWFYFKILFSSNHPLDLRFNSNSYAKQFSSRPDSKSDFHIILQFMPRDARPSERTMTQKNLYFISFVSLRSVEEGNFAFAKLIAIIC